MTSYATFTLRLSGRVSYSSDFEREIEADPYSALSLGNDPYGEYSGAYLAARVIASWWHGGQSSALYALASTGYFDRDALLAELADARICALASDGNDHSAAALALWIEGASADY